MAKIACMVGFIKDTTETGLDIQEEQYDEHKLRGNLVKLYAQNVQGDTRYDDMTFGNDFSLVADKFSYANFANIRYVIYLGQKWKVSNVTVQYPRLILSIGGVWNG